MKSLVLVFAAFVTVAFSACGNTANKSENTTKVDSTVVTTEQSCKAACDSANACNTACDSVKACQNACDSAKTCQSACESAKSHDCQEHCKK